MKWQQGPTQITPTNNKCRRVPTEGFGHTYVPLAKYELSTPLKTETEQSELGQKSGLHGWWVFTAGVGHSIPEGTQKTPTEHLLRTPL